MICTAQQMVFWYSYQEVWDRRGM